jgi:hypothetical protein
MPGIGRYLPSTPDARSVRPWRGYCGGPGRGASEYERAHPGVSIYEDEFGEHYAWKATPDGGELTHGRTEDELLAKLGG